MFAFPIDLFERLLILEDAKQLKNLAVAFLHPEAPIKSDEISKARCYFDRFSAPQQQSFEDTVYIENTLEDALNLKQLAINYMHPEIGIASSNPLTCARCNFSRYSAIEQESVEESEERAVILDDAIKLRQAARQYLYPEEGVVTSYAPSYGRCYFSRYSAIEQESVEESEERAVILDDAIKLRQAARQYLYPEEGVVTSYAPSYGRCYFSRYSAIEQESVEESEERAVILDDAIKLRQAARQYLYPEEGVVTSYAPSYGRCYFSRYSAIKQESVEKSDERAAILDDAMKLRQTARQYLYPEEGVVTSYAPSYGRSYFSRYSAIEQESVEKSDERAAILDDAMKLRQAARQYLQPVESVVSSDATSYGRCYFGRYSAIEQESVEESEEHQNVLNDALALKRLAMDYMHPEVRIVTSDLAACARCYFDSISAVRQDSYEEAEEHHKILVDALNLKILAGLSLPKSKTLPNTMELDSKVQNVSKSYSAVHLYGLDDDFVDASYF